MDNHLRGLAMDVETKEDVEVYAEIMKETKSGYYVTDWNGVQRHIPKSKVKAKARYCKRGNHYAFTISESFAIQKGFI